MYYQKTITMHSTVCKKTEVRSFLSRFYPLISEMGQFCLLCKNLVEKYTREPKNEVFYAPPFKRFHQTDEPDRPMEPRPVIGAEDMQTLAKERNILQMDRCDGERIRRSQEIPNDRPNLTSVQPVPTHQIAD